jgi:hypothetical protein
LTLRSISVLVRSTFEEGLERAVKARRPNDGDGSQASGPTAAARVRAEGEDFSASFHQLQDAVRGACRRQAAWEGKVVAGIAVALEFAATEPGKALALTVEARRPNFGERNPEQVVLAYFSERLSAVAPAVARKPISTDQSIVESIAVFIRGHLLGGTEARLPATAPDLVYLALMPYLGLEEARRWADFAVRLGEVKVR